MTDTKPNINVTPLIDVLLVLLIIFMVVSPLKPTDFKTKIPQEPNSRINEPNIYTLVVAINSDSTIKLNNTEIEGNLENNSGLIEKLSEIFSDREKNTALNENGDKIEKTVFIKAPRNLAYGKVVKVVDAVKIAGADPISLQIDDLE